MTGAARCAASGIEHCPSVCIFQVCLSPASGDSQNEVNFVAEAVAQLKAPASGVASSNAWDGGGQLSQPLSRRRVMDSRRAITCQDLRPTADCLRLHMASIECPPNRSGTPGTPTIGTRA
jgi:hypothetical protein